MLKRIKELSEVWLRGWGARGRVRCGLSIRRSIRPVKSGTTFGILNLFSMRYAQPEPISKNNNNLTTTFGKDFIITNELVPPGRILIITKEMLDEAHQKIFDACALPYEMLARDGK